MKMRQGFVSNSSSQSFCIIGIEDSKIVAKLLKAEKIVYGDCEVTIDGKTEEKMTEICGKHISFYGSFESEEPYWAGRNAEKMLQDMTIPQACAKLRDDIKESLGIDIPVHKIQFIYDILYSG